MSMTIHRSLKMISTKFYLITMAQVSYEVAVLYKVEGNYVRLLVVGIYLLDF